jgi:hypothetical protein
MIARGHLRDITLADPVDFSQNRLCGLRHERGFQGVWRGLVLPHLPHLYPQIRRIKNGVGGDHGSI